MKIRGKKMALAARTVTAFRQRRFSYEDWLIFCFGAGIIGGTALCFYLEKEHWKGLACRRRQGGPLGEG